jgi:hypothetical protein
MEEFCVSMHEPGSGRVINVGAGRKILETEMGTAGGEYEGDANIPMLFKL